MKKPDPNTADRHVLLDSAEDVPLKNIAYLMARGSLRENGWYSCTVDGTKTLFEVRS